MSKCETIMSNDEIMNAIECGMKVYDQMRRMDARLRSEEEKVISCIVALFEVLCIRAEMMVQAPGVHE